MDKIDVFDNDEIMEQFKVVMKLGSRTIHESIVLGEMLFCKKHELGHGKWLPFLEWMDMPERTSQRFMKAYKNKDNLLDGMTLLELIGQVKSDETKHDISNDSKYDNMSYIGLDDTLNNEPEPEIQEAEVIPDWFDENIEDEADNFIMRKLVSLTKSIEKKHGLMYIARLQELINKFNHLNYKDQWEK